MAGLYFEEFSEGQNAFDDQTVVAIKVKGSASKRP